MKLKIGLALVIPLLFVAPVLANSLATGDVLDITGFNNATNTVFWTGSLTLGAGVNPSLWEVSAFSVNPPSCSTCSPTHPAWTLTSLEFDSATGDLLGGASADFTGIVSSTHFLTLSFADGNDTADTWTDVNTRNGHTTMGTFSYTVSSPSVPEPASCLLLTSGLMFIIARRRMR